MKMRQLIFLIAAAFVQVSSLHTEPISIPEGHVLLKGKVLPYRDALPIATKMLDGSLEDQIAAAEVLSGFGDALLETPALDKLIGIVNEREDFSLFDAAISKGDSNGDEAIQKLERSPTGLALGKVSELKMHALDAVVMSGHPRGEALLRNYLSSSSPMARLIAEPAKAHHEQYGTWKLGRVPTKVQPKRYAFEGRSLLQVELLKKLEERLTVETSPLKVKNAVSLIAGHHFDEAIEGSKVFEQLIALFDRTAAAYSTSSDVRLTRWLIISIFSSSKHPLAEPFLRRAQNDPDPNIAKEASEALWNRAHMSLLMRLATRCCVALH